MKKLSMRIELEYDDDFVGDDDYDKQWLNDILLKPETGCHLELVSTDIGDVLGQVKVIDYQEINEPTPNHPELADCIKVGNRLWLVPDWTSDRTGWEVEVLSIGRKWVRLSGNGRCEKSGKKENGSLYPSQQAYKDSCELCDAWQKLSRKFEWGRMPKNVSMEDIRDVCAKLGFDDVTKGEK